MDDTNGHIAPDPSRPQWLLTHEQAERMIQLLFSDYRHTWGKINYEMWTGEKFTGRRARGQ